MAKRQSPDNSTKHQKLLMVVEGALIKYEVDCRLGWEDKPLTDEQKTWLRSKMCDWIIGEVEELYA